MSLTKAKLEQYVKQGQASQKLLKSIGKKIDKDHLLFKQLKQSKKLLDKINN